MLNALLSILADDAASTDAELIDHLVREFGVERKLAAALNGIRWEFQRSTNLTQDRALERRVRELMHPHQTR